MNNNIIFKKIKLCCNTKHLKRKKSQKILNKAIRIKSSNVTVWIICNKIKILNYFNFLSITINLNKTFFKNKQKKKLTTNR